MPSIKPPSMLSVLREWRRPPETLRFIDPREYWDRRLRAGWVKSMYFNIGTGVLNLLFVILNLSRH